MESFNEDLHELVEIKTYEVKLMEEPEHHSLAVKVLDKKVSHFNEKYDFTMQNIMFEIYDELCPDDEIKPIGEYLADHYTMSSGKYDAPLDEGVVVHLDDFSFKEGRLLLLPDPARIVLQNPETQHREVVWQAA